MEWSTSFEGADWVRERLHPFGRDVGSIVPDGFDAYARIVHPGQASQLPAPLLSHVTSALRNHTTTADDCWFCIWEGYGWLHGGHAVSGNPPGLVPEPIRNDGRARFTYRDYYLYRGDVTQAQVFAPLPWDLRPNLWWPTDRAWCVASDVDSICTYVGGTRDLVADLLADKRLTAGAIATTDAFQPGTDYFWR